VKANDNIDLTLRRGELHTLLGENGAGKSTLMNIISGLYTPDSGAIFLDGVSQHFRSPAQAIAAGIGMVHQHFMLVPNHTVAENITLGTPQPFVTRRKRLHEEIVQLGERYGLAVEPSKRVGQLSIGEQQRVEILKVLYRGARILILDEPTAVLTPQESASLYQILRQMLDAEHSVLFISHKMREVMDLSDRITVLRHGKVRATLAVRETNPASLARLMMGESTLEVQEIEHEADKRPAPRQLSAPVVALEDAGVCDPAGHWHLRNVNLHVGAGEIVGLAGVAGSGQSALAEVLTGLRSLDEGRYRFAGETLTRPSVQDLIRRGVGLIPEDRKRVGIAPHLSIAENFLLRDVEHPRFQKHGWLRAGSIRSFGREQMRQFDVRAASEATAVGSLSGGNIQKVILAREMSRPLKFLLASQPVRGLDIHATAFVQHQLLQARNNGLAILLITEDLDELFLLSDRIVVMCRGEIVDVLPRAEASLAEVGLRMTGVQS
jgi:simple sugar transport system ATP-binding protein